MPPRHQSGIRSFLRNCLKSDNRKIGFNFHGVILIAICYLPTALFSQQLPTLSYGTQVFNQVGSASLPIVSPVATLGVQTNQDPAFKCSTPGSVCAIANAGMGAHKYTYCIVQGNVSAIKIWGEGTDDNTITSGVSTPAHWQQITQTGIAPLGTSGCGTLEAGENYRFLRLHLDMIAGTGTPLISAWYRGIGTAIPGQGIITANQGAKPSTFNPANQAPGMVTLSAVTPAKSTAVAAIPQSQVLYGVSAANPNTTPVFASLQCNFTPLTIAQWEIPANDTRTPGIIPEIGLFCGSNTLVLCSTSSSSAVDPTNSCIFNFAYKSLNTVSCESTFAGTVVCVQQQTPN